MGQGGPQAQDRGDHPAPRGRLRHERRDRGPVRLGRRRPRAPVHRQHPRQGPHQDAERGADRGLQEAAPRRSAHGATTPASWSRACSSTSAGTTWAGSGGTSSTRSWTTSPRGWASSSGASSGRSPARTSAAIVGNLIESNRGLHPKDDIDHLGNRRIRANGRADPERVPDRAAPHGAGRPRADDDPGDRQGDAERPHQHPPRRGGDEGVLRRQPAQPVHGPDEPARGAHLQAAPVGPRARAACRASAPGSTSATCTTATTAGSARSRPRKARTSA